MKGIPARFFSSGGGVASATTLLATALVLAGYGTAISRLLPDGADRAAEEKLQSEVRALNAAVRVHAIFDKSLESSADVADALARLQVPVRGRNFVDYRLTGMMQDKAAASSGTARVIWNRVKERFEVAHGVIAGFEALYLDESREDPAWIAEQRRLAALESMEESDWTWTSGGPGDSLLASVRARTARAEAADN
jgi:hypothetical protein